MPSYVQWPTDRTFQSGHRCKTMMHRVVCALLHSSRLAMRTFAKGRRQGIQWALITVLEDLDYADDISLLSSKQQDAKQRSERLGKTANTVGL